MLLVNNLGPLGNFYLENRKLPFLIHHFFGILLIEIYFQKMDFFYILVFHQSTFLFKY